jgi:hypothetical protein
MKPQTNCRSLVCLFAVLLFALGLCVQSHGQATDGGITGLVTDSAGAVISQASVSVINQATGFRTDLRTNGSGNYLANGLIPGNYVVEVQATGFAKVIRTGIDLAVGQLARVDVRLSPGKVTNEITVAADAPLLQTETNEISQNFDVNYVSSLPVLSRDPIVITGLMAETNDTFAGNEFESIAGGSFNGNGWYVDGVMSEVRLDPVVQQARSVTDDMQEVTVTTNNHSSQFSGTSVIQFETKSGSNKWAGSAYYYGRNDALNALAWGANGVSTPSHTSSPGFTIGGPIKHDKLFFFLGVDYERDFTSQTDFRTVPTQLQRDGDFSQTFDASGNLVPIYDPASSQTVRTQFPGNKIPTNRSDAVGVAALGYYPLPNATPLDPSGFDNWQGVATTITDTPTYTFRVDHQVNPKNRMFYRFMDQPAKTVTGGAGNWLETVDPNAELVNNPTFSMAIGENYTVSQNVLSETRFGFTQRAYSNTPGSWDPSAAWPIQLGLSGVEPFQFPVFTPAGYGGLSAGGYYHQYAMRDFAWSENISWVKGAHSISFGGEVQSSSTDTQERNAVSGTMTFSPLETAQIGVTGTGNSIASMFLGLSDTASAIDAPRDTVHGWYYAAYVNDSWKVRPNFNLSYGLRWETSTPWTEENNLFTGFNPNAINPVSGTPGVVTFAGVGGTPRALFQQTWPNFSPTIGFSWNVAHNTVVRGGAGLIFNATLSQGGSHAFGDPVFGTNILLSSPNSGITPAMVLSQGFPAPPAPDYTPGYGAVPVGQAPTFGFDFFSYNRKPDYTEQFNFGIQRQLPGGLLAEAAYLGSLGRRLYASCCIGVYNDIYINVVPPALMGPGNAQVLRPFPQFGNIYEVDQNVGSSSYNALKLKIERHFKSGFGFMANYAYSKFLDNVSFIINPYEQKAAWGPSVFELPQRFVATAVYELPFGHNKPLLTEGPIAAVVGGWSLSTIFVTNSGTPLYINPVSNTTNAFSVLQGVDRVGDPNLSNRSMQQWFNQNAYAAPAPYTYGNAKSTLFGPGSWDDDVAVMRDFPISEGKRFQFRWEAYNWLNHPDLGPPGTTLGAPGFGVIGSKNGNRVMQYSVKFFF